MDPVRRERKGQMSDINVVPYIDVMLVLLVIFMVTMPLIQANVRVGLPDAKITQKPSRSNEKPIILSIDRHGNIELNFGSNVGNKLTNDELALAAKKLVSVKPNVEVLIKGHENVKYGDVIGPIAVLQSAGVKRVNLIMEFQDPRL